MTVANKQQQGEDGAFRQGQSYVRLPMDVVRMVGEDRVKVLNNVCTADIKKLAVGKGTEAFIPDVRGRCFGHVCIFNRENDLLLIGHSGQKERLVSHIDRYIIREDASFVDRSSDFDTLLISGQSGTWDCQWTEAGEGHLSTITHDAEGWQGYQFPATSDQDCLVLLEKKIHQGELPESIRQLSAATEAEFHWHRINNRWPVYGQDVSDANLPQEIDRDQRTISFTKGCYLGQETIARLDAMGQIQKKLVRLQIEGEGELSVPVELADQGKGCGKITSVAHSRDTSNRVAMGYVRRKWFASQSLLEIEGFENLRARIFPEDLEE